MEFFRIHKTIPFLKYRHILNGISLVSFLIAVYWIFTHGLAFSIEFTGGTQMEVNFPQAANTEQIRTDLKEISNEVLVQNFGTARDVVIRVPNKEGVTSGEVAANVMKVLEAKNPGVELRRTEFVGPQVGDELARDGGTALALVVLGIVIYLAFRFEWKFSIAAIIANLHDIVIVVGIFSVMQWEFSLPVLAAVLAVLGYSVNESVIIFDRVREHFRKMRKADTMEIIDSAITATISRTVITHSSTLCTPQTFRQTVEIPGNASALVYLPTADPEAISENGQPLDRIEGITVERKGDRTVLHIGSGVYNFSVRK